MVTQMRGLKKEINGAVFFCRHFEIGCMKLSDFSSVKEAKPFYVEWIQMQFFISITLTVKMQQWVVHEPMFHKSLLLGTNQAPQV